MKTKILSWVFVLANVGLSGCATVEPLKGEELIVAEAAGTPKHVGVVLAVQPVTINDTSTHARPSIARREFERGLIGTLAASKLFGRVVPGTDGDFLLASEIIAQEPVDPYSITIPILIHYRLIEAKSLRVVWKRNIFTQPVVPFERSFDDPTGERRHNRMLRDGIRDNFSRLATELRDTLQLQQRP